MNQTRKRFLPIDFTIDAAVPVLCAYRNTHLLHHCCAAAYFPLVNTRIIGTTIIIYYIGDQYLDYNTIIRTSIQYIDSSLSRSPYHPRRRYHHRTCRSTQLYKNVRRNLLVRTRNPKPLWQTAVEIERFESISFPCNKIYYHNLGWAFLANEYIVFW